MKWTEEIPSVPGWYWQRDADGSTRIIEFPHCGQWPTPWQKRRENLLAVCDESLVSLLKDKPDSFWIVKWAGPIPKPED